MQNIIGRRYGDADLDQDVDIGDFNSVAVNYDPLDNELFHGWRDGNFDGDDDVDFTDAMRVVLNYAADGYATVVGDVAVASDNNVTGGTWPGVVPLANPNHTTPPKHGVAHMAHAEDTKTAPNRLSVQPNDLSMIDDDFKAPSRKRSNRVNALRQDEVDWSIRVSRG